MHVRLNYHIFETARINLKSVRTKISNFGSLFEKH